MNRVPATPASEGLQRVMHEHEAPQVVRESYQPHKEAYNVAGLQREEYSGLVIAGDHKSALPPPPPIYQSDYIVSVEAAQKLETPGAPSRWRGWTRKRIALIAIAILVAIIVIVVPVAVTQAKKKGEVNSQPPSADTAAQPNMNTPSTSGAFNGTGLSSLIPSNPSDGEVVVFYQHFDGSLRQTVLLNGAWTGGKDAVLAQGNVRNGTPISSWQYTTSSTEFWHVVWVDQNNILQDLTQTNASGTWTPGVLSQGKFEASESAAAGLAMGRFNLFDNGKPIQGLGTTRVFYGDSNGILNELSLADNSTSWNVSHIFPENVNGHAGFSAAVPSGLAFLFYTSKDDNSLGYYYQEQDIGGGDLPFSNGDWTISATSAVTTLRNSSEVSYLSGTFAVFQDPSNEIITIKPSFAKPAGPWGSSQKVDSGLPGTRISSDVPKQDTGKGPLIYFQQTGNDIIQYQQNTKDLTWSMSSVTVE